MRTYNLSKIIKSKKGTVTVEAAIYFPIVFIVVISMIMMTIAMYVNASKNVFAHIKLYGKSGSEMTIDTSIKKDKYARSAEDDNYSFNQTYENAITTIVMKKTMYEHGGYFREILNKGESKWHIYDIDDYQNARIRELVQ